MSLKQCRLSAGPSVSSARSPGTVVTAAVKRRKHQAINTGARQSTGRQLIEPVMFVHPGSRSRRYDGCKQCVRACVSASPSLLDRMPDAPHAHNTPGLQRDAHRVTYERRYNTCTEPHVSTLHNAQSIFVRLVRLGRTTHRPTSSFSICAPLSLSLANAERTWCVWAVISGKRARNNRAKLHPPQPDDYDYTCNIYVGPSGEYTRSYSI